LVWLHLVFRYPRIDILASKPPTRAQAERPEFAPSEEPVNSNGVAVQVFGGILEGHNLRVLACLIPLHFIASRRASLSASARSKLETSNTLSL